MSSAQRLAFMELKRRLSTLEYQHNTLTSICTVLAKQVKDLRSHQTNSGSDTQKEFVTGNNNSLESQNTSTKSVEQMFKDRLQNRDKTRSGDVREISLSKKTQKSKKDPIKRKSRKKKVIAEPFSEEEESEDLDEKVSEEEESEEEKSEEEESEEEESEEEESEEEIKPVETKKLSKKAPLVKKVQVEAKAPPVKKVPVKEKVPVKKVPVKKLLVKTPPKQEENIAVEIVDSMIQ